MEKRQDEIKSLSKQHRWAGLLLGISISAIFFLAWCSFLMMLFWGTAAGEGWPLWLHLLVMGLGFIPVIPAIACSWWVASRLTHNRVWTTTAYTSIAMFIMWFIFVAIVVTLG